jgi:hypothetical protein
MVVIWKTKVVAVNNGESEKRTQPHETNIYSIQYIYRVIFLRNVQHCNILDERIIIMPVVAVKGNRGKGEGSSSSNR